MHAWQVITPSAGGPAERAGIGPRDGLVAIGDRKTEGLSLYEAGDLLQGSEGSEVTPLCSPCIKELQQVHAMESCYGCSGPATGELLHTNSLRTALFG